jgi:MerR family transcriptional regulator, light-induced transcriptional regulator
VAMQTLVPPPTQTTALLAALFALDELSAGRIVERHLRHYGVLETWESLIRPVFAEIESQQAAGERCIDIEHLLSRTTVSCLQRLPMAPAETPASVILACTEEDTHTLALEALRAALSERDHAALMLGAAVPAAAVIDALARRADPIAVVLWAQTDRTADAAAVKAVRAAHTRVMVAGPGWDSVRLPAGVAQLHSLDDAIQRLTAPD